MKSTQDTKAASRYLDAAKETVDFLFEKQSAHWGGRANGLKCITIENVTCKKFRCIGTRVDGPQTSFSFEMNNQEPEPFRLDMRIWPALEMLSEVTGDSKYRDNVCAVAREFCKHGFDEGSGLPYLGEMADFDIIQEKPVGTYPGGKYSFKQADFTPLAALWDASPKAMLRMSHSIFYGLIQREPTMDYNRFCEYEFDDSKKKPCREFHPGHHSTAYAGAYMIHWWAVAFARTGDAEVLKWAQAMTDKWKAVQHPVSGLVPAWFGVGRDNIGVDDMPPQPYTNNWDGGTAISYLLAVKELRKRSEGQTLADELEKMSLKLLKGLARYDYDSGKRTFAQWVNIDGSPRTTTTWYTYYSQAEKDEALKADAELAEVSVFSESGFYEAICPWISTAGNFLPYHIARAAKMTGDSELLEIARGFSSVIMHESRKLDGEFNAQGQWIMPANASYVKMQVTLFEITGEKQYLDAARKLADLELGFLNRALPKDKSPWWRMYFRNAWIEALLLLHRALARL